MEECRFYNQANKMALKVEFLTCRQELFIYAYAVYSAIMWGREVDEKNRVIQKMDKSIK